MNIITNGDFLDLETPIYMTESQKKEFVNFMEKQFGIKTEEIIEPDIEEGEEKEPSEQKKWTAEEFCLLFDYSKTNSELAKLLDRTEMSIHMKRGGFVPEFLVWAKNKKYTNPITKKMIEEYLK